MAKGESFAAAVLDKCIFLRDTHMNKAKVNTNNSDVTSSGPKNPVEPSEYVGQIDTPFGVQHINRGDSLDCAHMYSKQLTALLVTMHGEGLDRFLRLDNDSQHQLVWLALQLAERTAAMFDIVARDIREGSALGWGTV